MDRIMNFEGKNPLNIHNLSISKAYIQLNTNFKLFEQEK